ncbi:MAG TPA: substrate-binding domain-containing protein [Candidatus Limnocylindrales bacterium]|jgi:ribose transport system substrate-binding protein|nr:substrate-binding domain-containing protein [Candidatus Limnocylindrales bacterium]
MTKFKTVGVALAAMMLAAACAGPGTTPGATPAGSPAGTPAGEGYRIGVSNTIAGNGWREEMICSIRAQALASGEVSELRVAHRNTDPAGQLEDLRSLIAADVDAIIVNPAGADAVNAALQEAIDAGIVVVAVDQAVTLEDAYLMANNQEEYGYLGAKWLFEQMGGSGDVVYMRGAAGATADDDRDRGFRRALGEHPDINIVHEDWTGWSQDTGVQQLNAFLATGQNYDGIWTSGIDNVIVDALRAANAKMVPVVGADNAGFVQQLIEMQDEGVTGAAVTNPASVGGAGVALALQILKGQGPSDRAVLVNPEVWDNTTDAGRAKLQEANDPDIDPTWPLGIHIEGWTTYTKDQILACTGP